MPPDSQRLVDSDGTVRDVPSENVAASLAQGWHAPTPADTSQLSTEAAHEQDFGGVGGAIKAGAYGVARGATLGFSDVAFRGLGAPAEHLRGLQEHNPISSTVGEFAGALIPSLAAPESLLSRTPAGAVSGIGRKIVQSAEGAGVGALEHAGAATVSAGVEGALYGGGQYLSQVALEDKPLSAEGFVGAMGHGALFAAPVGGALSLGGSALQRARSLFPQRVVTQEAAKAIDKEAVSAVGQAVSDGDQMAAAVQRRLGITESKIGMAEAGEGVTRRMFGAADPQAIGDQVTGGVDRAQMTSALQRYNASKAQLSDWIREEADPALEAALTGVAVPEVGQAGGRIEKLPGKFGEPELAGGTPVSPANRELMDALANGRSQDPTMLLRAPALPPVGDDSLEALLAGTKAQLDSGKSLGEVAGRPKLGEAATLGPVTHPTLATSANADNSLEALLAGTKAKLDEGATIGEIGSGSKLRKDYVTSKQLEVGKSLTETPGAAVAAAPQAAVPSEGPVRIEIRKTGRPSERKMEVTRYQNGKAVGEPQVIHRDEAADLLESTMPPGYQADKVDRFDDFVIAHGVPKTPADIVDNAVYVVRPSELVERGILGNEIRPGDLESVRHGFAEGKTFPMLQIDMASNGEMWIVDGNHRLQASAAGDRPMAVKFTTVNERTMKRQFNPSNPDIDLTSRLRAELPKVTETPAGVATVADDALPRHAAAPADDLEALLAGTKKQLDAGVAIKDVKPGVAIPETAPLEFREPQPKTTHFDIADTNMKFDPLTRTYHTPEATAASLPRPGQLADLDALLGTGAKSHVPRSDLDAFGASAKRDATSVLRRPSNENLGKTIVDRELRSQMKTLGDDDKIARILAKRPGKNVDMGPGLAKAAKAIGDHESALADLVEILGPEAPASAVANAKAYRAATTAQSDALASSAAKSADHITTKLEPKLAEATKGKAGTALGVLADVGSAMEVLQAMGVHTPDVKEIPVIGPVLSLFLKARAVMGIIGRKGGSVGRSMEGRIATKSAEVRNRMAVAAGAALEVAGRGAKKASAISAGPTVTLANRLFPGDENPKTKNPRELYAARMDDLARAQQPGAIEHAVSDRIMTADPHLQDAIVAQVERGLKFLDSKAPKQTTLPGMIPGDGPWHPSKTAIETWGRYVHAVNDPASVLEDLAKGHATVEGAETLRVVYPKLFAEAQRTLLENAAKLQVTLPYARRVAISIMYQVPVDATMTPSHMQYLQPPPPPAGGPPGAPAGPMGPPPGAPAITGPLKIGQSTMTSLDRRAGK